LATVQAVQTRQAGDDEPSSADATETPSTDEADESALDDERPSGLPAAAVVAEVSGHVDGDKLTVSVGGQREEVLLVGQDAPELDEGPLGECYADEAADGLQDLLPEGETVYLESEGDDRDGQDRLLRHVWYDDDGEAFLASAALLDQGFGSFESREGFGRHTSVLLEAESNARDEEAGLWGECGENHVENVAPTPTPEVGDAGLPAPLGTKLTDGNLNVTLTSAYVAYAYGIENPRGGYVFLVVELAIENIDDEDHGYADDRLSVRDINTGAEFQDIYEPTEFPLRGGDLSPGEYVSGLVVVEIQETASVVSVQYDTAFAGGRDLNWLVETGL